MTTAQMRVSRAVWRVREKFRHNRWSYYQTQSKLSRPERLKLAAKWWNLYDQAHNHRVWYDRQLHAATAPTGVSERGVSLIKDFEGFPNNGYAYRDPVGVLTIGYGTTTADVNPLPHHLTEPQAAALLRSQLDHKYLPAITALHLPLNQNQVDALVSFVYNVGPGGVAANTNVGRALRAHDWRGAADGLLAWDHAGGSTLPGLTRRRHAERDLFLS